MKKSLLAFSMLSLGAALSASAEEARYYVIKDGQLADGIVQRPYLPVAENTYDTLICGQEYDGKKVAAYVHQYQGDNVNPTYNDVRFDLSANPLDLSKTWVMTLKYRIPTIADSANYNTANAMRDISANDGTKPAFFFALAADKDSIGLNYMDFMFNVQGAVESLAADGAWMTKELYLVAPAFLKEANSFVMGYAREAAANIEDEPAYIEELSFHSAGEFPFFAEDFSPKMSNVWSDVGKLLADFEWKSGAEFSCYKTLSVSRIWNKPWDASEVPSTEIAHAVKCPQVRDSFIVKNIEVPAGVTSFVVHALAKADPDTKTQDAWDALAETPAERPLTVLAVFDNGESVPVFPNYVRKSQWEWAIGEVAVPAGATKFDLRFTSKDCVATLLINEILIAKNKIDLSAYYGKAASNDVADFFASAPAAEVYVADGVVYAVENASSVEVISLNGTVVASAEANNVNISGLAEGVYVVRVTTANGVAAAIIKK